MILGVWREKNRLVQYNGDLLDRVAEIPVEPWSKNEFTKVAFAGQIALNIEISNEVVDDCITASFSSIGVFQELLKEVCQLAGIKQCELNKKMITDRLLVKTAVVKKADDYAARHQRALEAIGSGNVSSTGAKDGVTPLFLPYFLVKVLLASGYEGLANGMRRAVLHEKIQVMHHRPQDVRASDMSNLLYNLANLQSNKGISPPIIDFDKNNKMLQIVDSTFYFFLKHADLLSISEELPSPIAE